MSEDKWPNYPPYDSQVVVYQGAILKKDPKDIQKTAKFCPICDYPIHVRVVLYPCTHYQCYQCYSVNTRFCRVCDSMITQMKRLGDNQQPYSCDIDCHKVFESYEALKKHYKFHDEGFVLGSQ